MLRPRLGQRTLHVTIGDTPHTVEVWSDMSALEAVRLVVGRSGAPSRCEYGMCGTCEALVDGVVTRICSVGALKLEGTTVILKEQA